MEITFEDAVKICETARLLAEQGQGPDLGDLLDRITEQWPELIKECDQ
jgi:hypothetical protein